MSVARSRQRRRRPERAPAVLRPTTFPYPAEGRVPAEHGARSAVGVSWRLFSGMMVAVLTGLLIAFFASDNFYVRSITVSGSSYLSEAEVFRYTGVAESHLFWVDPQRVRENLIGASPVIADARVRVSWPPQMVDVVIQERQPVVIWTQGGVTALVDLQGRVLRFPPEAEIGQLALIRVQADPVIEEPPQLSVLIPVEVISGALQLQSLLAGIPGLRYHPVKGLGFREPGSYDVWLGVGADMPEKLRVYEALRDNLQARGIAPVEINVAHLDAVYYCGSDLACYE